MRPVVVVAYSTAALALAVQWTAAKIALREIPPFELSTLRFAVASAVLVVLAVVTRTRLPLERGRPVAAAAALGFLGFNGLAFLGLRLTPASDSALIVPTVIPVATALLATFIRERLTAQKAAGFAVASVGAAIVIGGGQEIGGQISSDRLVGDLLEVASAVSWAGCLTVSALVVRSGSVLGFVTLACLLGTAMLFPFGYLENGFRDAVGLHAETLIALAVLGVISTVVAFLIFFWAVSRFGAGLAALISYLAPVGGLVATAVVLGERPHPLQLVGAAIILIGVRVAARRAPPAAVAAPA